jgi:hypothetical protein
MSTNYILEYRVKDPDKIKLVSPELPDARPLSSAELQKQFADLCGSPVGRRVHDSCIEMRNLLSKYSRPGTSLFFFGVGLSVMEESKLSRFDEDYHAVTFFNDVLLKSFPHLTDKRLAPMAKSGREGEGSARGMLMPAVLQVQSTRLRLLPVSAVIDCKVGGIIVTVMQ